MASRSAWQGFYAIQQNTQSTYPREWAQFKNVGNDSPAIASNKGILGTGAETTDDLGRFLLDITGSQPHLPPTSSTLDTERTVGKSERYSIEFDSTASAAPVVTIETPADAYKLSLFLWLLMQNGASEADNGTTRTATYVPYTSADTEIYASLYRVMVDQSTLKSADFDSHALLGCICTELTISANEGGLLMLSATLMGMAWHRMNVLGKIKNSPRLAHYPIATGTTVTVKYWDGNSWENIDASATEVANDAAFTAPGSLAAGSVEWSLATGNFNFGTADLATYSGKDIAVDIGDALADDKAWNNIGGFALKNPLKWQDATITLDGNAVNLPGFSLTLKNNATAKFYDDVFINKFVLGRFGAEGEIRIPWGTTTEGGNTAINDFIDGTDLPLVIYWGNSAAATGDAEFSITANIRHTAIDVSGDTEIESGSNFSCVYDGTNAAITLKCGYNEAELIRGIS